MYEIIDSIDVPRLHQRLGELFKLKNLTKPLLIHGGRRCLNMRIESDSSVYFLKKYRQSVSETVHEVKYAEKFYFDHGIPVIMPLPDIHERFAFWFDGNWFSLFPYVDGVTVTADPMPVTLRSMGRMLGRMHAIGTPFLDTNFTSLRLWDWRRFYSQYTELMDIWEHTENKTSLGQSAVDLLVKKEHIIRDHINKFQDVSLQFETLLHGDFIYANMFVNPLGEVAQIYDFEQARRGPRAFEFARSLFINCFDDGWDEKQKARARVFACAYAQEAPLTIKDLAEGVKSYLNHIIRSTWIETGILQAGKNYADVLASHYIRFEHLNDDWNAFCRDLFTS